MTVLLDELWAEIRRLEGLIENASGACWHFDCCDDDDGPFLEYFTDIDVARRLVASQRAILYAHTAWVRGSDGAIGKCWCGSYPWPCESVRAVASALGVEVLDAPL